MAASKRAPAGGAARKPAAKRTPAPKRPAKRDPTPAAMMRKVEAAADSGRAIQKEVRAMARIFAENQKVLVSMKGMIDSLGSALEHVQRHSRQLSAIEGDTQKLFAGLSRARSQYDTVARLNEQTARLQDEVKKVAESAVPQGLSERVDEGMNSIRNNSQMIIRIAQRIDEVRDDLRRVSGRTDSLARAAEELEGLKKTVEEVSAAASGPGPQIIESMRAELGRVAGGAAAAKDLASELGAVKEAVEDVAARASRIDALGGVIDGLRRQLEAVSARADSADVAGTVRGLAAKIDGLESEVGALAGRAEEAASVGEGLGAVRAELGQLRQSVAERADGIDGRVAAVSEEVKRHGESAAAAAARTEGLFEEIRQVRGEAGRAADGSSREMMALLRLAEFQSAIRMNSESKYGDAADLEKMAVQTAGIAALFEGLASDAGGETALPREVVQWAVSKIFECADRWEVRFGDVYAVLSRTMGKRALAGAIRTRQVREIYGMRAVDELRADLGIS